MTPAFRRAESMLAAILLLSLRAASVLAADDAAATAGLRPGTEVVLKAPGVPLQDRGHMVSGQDYLIFVVDRVEQGRVFLYSRDKRVTGSLHLEQVVPIDQALEFFSSAVDHDARNAEAYWMRSRLYLYHDDAERGWRT